MNKRIVFALCSLLAISFAGCKSAGSDASTAAATAADAASKFAICTEWPSDQCGTCDADLALIKASLDKGVAVDAVDPCGRTMLMSVIASTEDPEAIRHLLKAGADPNRADFLGVTPLMEVENPENVKALIDAGADVNAKGPRDKTPLMFARNYDVAKLLLDAGADAKAMSRRQNGPLVYASTVPWVQMLLDAGADPNAKDINGTSPYFHALRFLSADVVKTYLAAGCNPNDDSGKLRPLMLTERGEIVRILLAAGADASARDELGRTALMFPKDLDAVNALLDAGLKATDTDEEGYSVIQYQEHATSDVWKRLIEAGADVNSIGVFGNTLLMNVANPAEADMLLKAGADVKIQNKHGSTALHAVCHNTDNPAEIARILIAAGADPNARDDHRWTPLLNCVDENSPETVDVLLKAGADVNAQTGDGTSALMLAVDDNLSAVADLLIAAKANVDAQDADGDTALMWAARTNARWSPDMVRKLLQAGAKPNIRSGGEQTAIMMACSPESIRSLIAAGADVSAHDITGRSLYLFDCYRHRRLHGVFHGSRGLDRIAADYRDALDALTKAGLDLNARDEEGKTALIVLLTEAYAIEHDIMTDAMDSIEARIAQANEEKADEDDTDEDDDASADADEDDVDDEDAPLMDAPAPADLRKQFLDAHQHAIAGYVSLLLELGADPSIQDNDGKTALDYAREQNLTEIVAILEAAKKP